jgi:hypothetical protein
MVMGWNIASITTLERASPSKGLSREPGMESTGDITSSALTQRLGPARFAIS